MAKTTMNYPNYRLGPLDSSPCDTLGYNNEPLAEFRVRTDSTLEVKFIDRSAYEPSDWYWTFGDGMTSQDTSPVHTYLAPGVYEVCQTVSNANGSDTYCRDVNLISTSSENPETKLDITLFPNPASDILNVNVSNAYPIGLKFRLFNMLGREVKHLPLGSGIQSIDLMDLKSGLYFYHIQLGQTTILSDRVIIH